MISIDNLHVAYGHTPVVSGVSFDLHHGSTLAIVGESGSGKTTTASAIMGLLPKGGHLTSGVVRFAGEDITGWSDKRMATIRGPKIGWIPQDPGSSLNPVKRIGDSIAEVMHIHRAGTPAQIRARVLDLLDRVGITSPDLRARQYPHELSGGMQQRVLIASAIALNPHVLIADEATSNLDVTVQKSILDLLADLRRESGMATLLITHDLGVATDRASRVLVLKDGQVVETGRTVDILTRPREPYTIELVENAPAFTSAFALTSGAARTPAVPPRGQAGAPVITHPQPRTSAPRAEPVEAVIEVRDLTTEFATPAGTFRAVDGVSFAVPKGTNHALVGESGSGKTTTARTIMGFTRPTSGTVSVAGANPHELSPADQRAWRAGVQMVYQNPFASLNPRHEVQRIIAEPLKNFRFTSLAAWATRTSKAERARKVAELLDALALPQSVARKRVHELSGGMRQRVAIARALAPSPDVLVLDEATSALDVTVQAQILDLLAELQQEFSLSYLFISHNLAVVRQVADTVTVLKGGVAVESGTARDVFTTPAHPYTAELLSAVPGRVAWDASLTPLHV